MSVQHRESCRWCRSCPWWPDFSKSHEIFFREPRNTKRGEGLLTRNFPRQQYTPDVFFFGASYLRMHRSRNVGNCTRLRPSLSILGKRSFGTGCASIIGIIGWQSIRRAINLGCTHLMRADFCKHNDEQSFKKRGSMLDFEANPIVHDHFMSWSLRRWEYREKLLSWSKSRHDIPPFLWVKSILDRIE